MHKCLDKKEIKSCWRVVDLINNEMTYEELTLNEVAERRADSEISSGEVIERPVFNFNEWKGDLPEDSCFWFRS